MTPDEKWRTPDQCDKIRADCRKGRTGLMVTIAILILGWAATAVAFALQKAEVDATQTQRIVYLEQQIVGVNLKLDKILDRLPAKP